MNLQISFLSFIFFVISVNFSCANDLDDAWTAFNVNDRVNARKYFKAATRTPELAAEAWLGLSYLSNYELDAVRAQDYFLKFYELSKKMQPEEKDAYLYACWLNGLFTDGYGIMDKKHLKIMKEIALDTKSNGTIRALANYMLGRHYRAAGNFKNERIYFGKVGSIPSWSATGSFDNTSGSGFDKDYGPLGNPQKGAVFVNKYKAEVTWYEVIRNKAGDWIDLSYYLDNNDGLSYLQTFIESPVEQEVYLGLGPSGAIKVWLNDQLVLTEEEEYAMDLDAMVIKVKLHKGGNRLLIQLGESARAQADVIARILDEQLNLIPGFQYNATFIPYEKETDYEAKSIPLFAEEFFQNKIKSSPNNLLNYLLLSDIYMHNRKIKQGLDVMIKARMQAPKNSFLVFKQMLLLEKDENRTELTKQLEWIKTNDKEAPVSFVFQIEEASSNKNYDLMESLLHDLEKEMKGVNQEVIYEYQVDLLTAREKYQELIALNKKAFAKYPTNGIFLNLKYVIAKNAYKDPLKAIAILKKYLSENYDPTTLLQLSRDYMDIGQPARAVKVLKELIDNYPNRIGYYVKLSDFYYSNSDYEKANIWIDRVLRQVPYNSYFYQKKGLILQQMGKKAVALAALKKSLYYNPNMFSVREKIRALLDEPNVFDYFESEDAYQLFDNAPSAEDYPDDNSIILLDEIQRVVYKEGVSEKKVNLLVKIFNDTGIETWKEYYLGIQPYYQRSIIEKAEVIKADGNRVTAETNNGNVIFTGLEPGDAIHLSYKVQDQEYGKLLGYFSDKKYMEYFVPVKISRYQVLTPTGFDFEYKMLGQAIEPQKTSINEGLMTLYDWTIKDRAAITYENSMPKLGDVATVLHISNFPSWKFVADWYSDVVTSQLKGDYETDEIISKLFPNGYEGLADEIKARRIYDYIADNIAYSSIAFRQSGYVPQKPSKTIRTRLGDCKDMSTLFVVLGKEVGLESQLVLVDTRDNGQRNIILPSVAFNHCIVKLKMENKAHFLELTNKYNPFIANDTYLDGATALEIPNNTLEQSLDLIKINMKDERPSLIHRETSVKMEGADMLVRTKTYKTNTSAMSMRYSYKGQRVKNQEKTMLEAVSSDFDNPVELLDFSFDNLDENTSDTLSYLYEFKVTKPVININKMKLVKLPWADVLRTLNFITDKNRTYPYDTWDFKYGYRIEDTDLEFELPEGRQVIELPENVEVDFNGFIYKMTLKQEGNVIKAHRYMKYVPILVSPENYPQLKTFFEKVLEADNSYISF